MRRCERGFTLLEVLAAVALLGVLYTVLSGVAAQGLRGEGESRRRLEASLLADRLLAEIETGLNQGVVPPTGSSEAEESAFAVRTEITAFELPELPDDPGADEAPRSAAPVPTLFPDGSSQLQSPVRRIDLTVSWVEGFDERSVARTTFALDLSDPVAAGALRALAAREVTP